MFNGTTNQGPPRGLKINLKGHEMFNKKENGTKLFYNQKSPLIASFIALWVRNSSISLLILLIFLIDNVNGGSSCIGDD